MGVDQPDVDKVIRIGVPPSLEQLVQEFGRAGRDSRLCAYLQHATFWCKGEVIKRQLQILSEFQLSWRFIYSHMAGRCRRLEIISHFEEITSDIPCDGTCCDVCSSKAESEMLDAAQEMKLG
jgi:superfamily II DNA helicase RecQ